jgi:hypothetical protein
MVRLEERQGRLNPFFENRHFSNAVNLGQEWNVSNISFNVPMIPQGNNDICWAACLAMITSFKTNATVGVSTFTGGFELGSSCIGDGPTQTEEQFASLLDGFGFTSTGMNMSIDSSFILDTLQSHGPFMITVIAGDFPFSGPVCINDPNDPDALHCLIVNGIDTDSQKVMFVNPWEPLFRLSILILSLILRREQSMLVSLPLPSCAKDGLAKN